MQNILTGAALALLIGGAALPARAETNELDYYAKRLDAAKQHCGSDNVLWLNTKTGAIAKPGSSDFGTTDTGRYVCEHDVSQGRYGTRAEPTSLAPGGTESQPAPTTPPK
jgi:hypothetical protein